METPALPPPPSPPPQDLVERIRQAARNGNYFLGSHAYDRMNERSVAPNEVREVMIAGEAIEFDPSGTRGEGDSILFNRPLS